MISLSIIEDTAFLQEKGSQREPIWPASSSQSDFKSPEM